MPGLSVLEARKGDKEVYTGLATRLGVAVTIQGKKTWFTAKRRYSDTDAAAVIKKGTTGTGLSGVTVLDDGTPEKKGQYQVVIASGDTDDLNDTALVFDVQVDESVAGDGSELSTLDSGILRLLRQTTIATT